MNIKKKVFPKTGALFFPNSSGDLRSHTHQSQSIGLDADVDHTQIIGDGGQSSYWGGYIHHLRQVSAFLSSKAWGQKNFSRGG